MIQKIFVSDNNIAIFVCPNCNVSKSADVSKYKRINKSVKLTIKCPCGNVYSVLMEMRRHYRKQVSIPGKYVFNSFHGKVQNGALTVVDISRRGLGLNFRTIPPIQIGSVFVVEFNLDDKQHTLIKKQVSVMRLVGQFVGVEFCSIDPSDPSDKALGFYLF
ncbi:Type IV pilus assembly PilZ [uncultured Desulfobacterium sp.]|uniref:Type IV pilus assembly PilZ n=1 Tax=uncultured Desulfobacterium sp. TaxID=201089 RepID=A0A445MX10_9BACT|nr:Type IV pilus assembly PilZ [uncultured Desulfobacterium sp.]